MSCTTGSGRSLILWAIATGVMLGFLLIAVDGTQAETVYTENFGTSASNASLSSVGWGAWVGSGAVDYSTATTGPMYIYHQYGGSDGPYFTAGASVSPIGIATTTEAGVIDTGLLESISFQARNKLAVSQIRVAVKVDGDWYASDDVFGNADGAAWGPTSTLTWNSAAAEWRQLDFTPGSTLALGGAANSDLSGSATEFGLYVDANPGGSYGSEYIMRIDNFAINAASVPEPASAVLMVAGLVALLAGVGSRRRRNVS